MHVFHGISINTTSNYIKALGEYILWAVIVKC